MKKLLSLLLVLTLVISCANIGITFAEEANIEEIDFSELFAEYNLVLEKDSTFEIGTPTWNTVGSGTVQVEENPVGEGNVLSFSSYDVSKAWSSPQVNIGAYIRGGITEEAYVSIYLKVYSTVSFTATARIRTANVGDYSGCTTYNYCAIGTFSVRANQWTPIEVTMPITESDLAKTGAWNFCFDGAVEELNGAKIYIDDFYVGTVSPTFGAHKKIPEKTPITRSEYTKIGTFRWDAFTKSGAEGAPSTQVAEVLSPAKYHNQAPFFSIVNDDGTISFPEYTVETWEMEAQYAHDAGLDYFAYLWYGTESAMSQPRKMHLLSENKDLIEMTGILEVIRDIPTMNEMFLAMRDSVWLRLDNRPVVFLYSLASWTKEDVQKLRQMAANAGVTEALYIIGATTAYDQLDAAYDKDIDAVSWYSNGASMQGQPYGEYVAGIENLMETMLEATSEYDHQVVPCFSFGRDSRARIETGVTWVDGDPNAEEDKDKPYANRYSTQPAMTELKEHVANTYKLVQEYSSKTQPNLICSYAWNEHEEGGWLCPTLNCDAEGNVILDENGDYTYNTERVDALKEVIQSLREETHVSRPTPDANAVKTVYNGNAELGTENWSNIHAGSIGYIQPGANGTNNAIRFIPDTTSKYSSVAYNFGGAVINDSQYNYSGCGAGTYTVTFYAKAEAGYGGSFSCMLSSKLHLQDSQVRNLLGYTEGDGNYVNDTYFTGGSITLTDQWTKFTVNFSVSDNWLNMMKKVRNSSHAQASKAYELVLRLDGSNGAYKENVFFDYYIDEFTVKHNSLSVPTPTLEVQIVTTPTPKPTAIPLELVKDYLEYTVEDNLAVITSVSSEIQGDVTLPQTLGGYNIGAIGEGAFKNAAKLTSITLPETVTSIGEHAFEKCFNLEKITAKGVIYIGRHAFCGCESLTGDVSIPATTKIINAYAFHDCVSLENIEYAGTENKFKESVTVKEGNETFTSAITFTSGDFAGAMLNLGATLTLDYYVSTEADVNDTFMRFTSSSGRVTEVTGAYDETYKMYKYTYTGINPQCMTDSIDAELFHKDGSLLGKHENYSVGLYCERQMNKSAESLGYSVGQYESFRTLLADMLVYGAEAQKYKEYRLEYLADGPAWVKAHKSDFGVPKGVKEISGNADSENRVRSLGVHIANVNKILFKLVLTDDAKVLVNDEEISRSELILNADGTYTYYSPDLKATEFDKVFTVKILQGENVLSTVSYNVYAYVQSKYDDETVGGIAKALFNYGNSAKAYVKAMNEVDADFDLSDEDNINEPPSTDIVDSASSTFEGISSVSQTRWSKMGGSKVTLSLRTEENNQFLVTTYGEGAEKYHTPSINIMPYITVEGSYTVTFRYKITTKGSKSVEAPMTCVIRTESETSFSTNHSGNYYLNLNVLPTAQNDVWYTHSETVAIPQSDIGVGGFWDFCFHQVKIDEIAEICIDDFTITGAVLEKEQPVSVSYAETWRANEITLISDKKYDDPYRDVDVSLTLTNGEVTYTVPGFWDGGDIWRIRFMCPTAGRWTYTTVCTDTENAGLHNQVNTLLCTEYAGDLDVYKRGHVTVEEGVKYFTYSDGTPFFYLADTHWNLGNETVEMVETITENRVANGYSVIQSEPLGAVFKFENGITLSDIADLRVYDQKFQIIADAGLTHVNASFFYPSSMTTFINNFGGFSDTVVGTATHSTGEYEMYDLSESVKVELERACRYWVARYSAYPVMWSLGQEVDNDFFWNRDNFNGHEKWSYVNNPYHYVAEYISKHDPYNSPLTAHQEGVANAGASKSSFRDMEEHDFFALQWSPSLTNENNNHTYAKDAWDNGQGKPVVNYEGRYCYLWTKNFGARAQGWIAYLSGVYGYAWGGQDTWSYLNTYDENTTSSDGVDTITPEEKKAATWEDSLTYPSAIQVGYMRKFFEGKVNDGSGGLTGLKSGKWWELIPRFDSTSYLKRSTGAYANIASNEDNSETVIYFFNFSETSVAEKPNSTSNGTATGKIYSLDNSTTYNYMWFDPISGTVTSSGQFKTSILSSILGYSLPTKPAGTDYVLYIYK